jgi:hypothetical protein
MTFSVEDHGMVYASSALVQAFVCPQEISINFDHLAAIRSALGLVHVRRDESGDSGGRSDAVVFFVSTIWVRLFLAT